MDDMTSLLLNENKLLKIQLKKSEESKAFCDKESVRLRSVLEDVSDMVEKALAECRIDEFHAKANNWKELLDQSRYAKQKLTRIKRLCDESKM